MTTRRAPDAPAELKARDQWVVWRKVGAKQKKVLFNPKTGQKAKSNDPTTWTSYTEAARTYQLGGYDGIGYVFSPDDPYVGVDLDDCRSDNELAPWAQVIVDALHSYTEISPSGNGVKVWVEGSIPSSVKVPYETGAIEMYSERRYFTVTGERLATTPATIGRANGVLHDLYDDLSKRKRSAAASFSTVPADYRAYYQKWARDVLSKASEMVAHAPERTKHNARLDAARLAGGLVPHGLATEAQIEALVYHANEPRANRAAERKTILDAIEMGKAAPLELPTPPEQPIYNTHGVACCPRHETPLVRSKNGNGWHCEEYDCFWWQGENYTEPMPPAPTPVAVQSRFVGARSLLRKEFEHVDWPVADILPPGVTLLSGPPKSFKSWLALQVAVEVSRGGAVLGRFECVKGKVAYLDLESSQRRMQGRLRAMAPDAAYTDDLMIATEWERGDAAVAALDATLKADPDIRVFVIDILAMIRAPRQKNGNVYDEDYAALQPINLWAENNRVAVLIIHHTRKARGDDPFEKISGSNAISGAVSAMWMLERAPSEGKNEAILRIRGRDIQLDEDHAIRWDEDAARHVYQGSSEMVTTSSDRRAILQAMQDGNEYTAIEIAQVVGKSRTNVANMLRALVSAGKVERRAYGRYALIFSSDKRDTSNSSNGTDKSDSSDTSKVNQTDVTVSPVTAVTVSSQFAIIPVDRPGGTLYQVWNFERSRCYGIRKTEPLARAFIEELTKQLIRKQDEQ